MNDRELHEKLHIRCFGNYYIDLEFFQGAAGHTVCAIDGSMLLGVRKKVNEPLNLRLTCRQRSS